MQNFFTKHYELKQRLELAEYLNMPFSKYELVKAKKDYTNAYQISNNLIYFYPLNDGKPTCIFEFFSGKTFIIGNDKEYSQIANLDEILLQMVRLFDKAFDDNIVLDAYYFMLELTDSISNEYSGNARLVISDKCICNPKINPRYLEESKKWFINDFLDHFMGWNFGLSINRSEELKEELEALNIKVIESGMREYAGSGFEIYGNNEEAIDGLQHYYLSTEKPKIITKM